MFFKLNNTMKSTTKLSPFRKIFAIYAVLHFFVAHQLTAQANFQPGYIVKNAGDTLSGWIDYRVASMLSQSCSFRLKKDSETMVFKPDELRSYHFDNGKTLITEKIDGTSYFLEALYQGCVEIYFLKTELGDDRFFAKKADSELFEITYTDERVIEDGKILLKESRQHILVLKKLMQDQMSLFQRIEQMGRPNAFNLVPLAKAYQKKACPEQEIPSANKKSLKLSVALEAIGGLVNYQDTQDDFDDKNYFESGLIVHVGSSRNAGKLFLRTGLLFSKLDKYDGPKVLVKIPVQLEYMYPGAVVQPRLALGLGFFKPLYQSIMVTTGVNVKLKKSTFFTFNYDLDMKPLTVLFIVPSNRILANTLTVGLVKKLGK
jgi:hypothetical protein